MAAVRIRSYRSSTDTTAVHKYFAEGMHSMIYEGIRRILAVQGPFLTVTCASFSGVAYYNGWSASSAMLCGVVPFVSILGFEILVLRRSIHRYVQRSLNDDLKNIDAFYMNNKPSHFWVAADEATDDVIGCIALESKADGWGELRRLTVSQSGRRRGVASKLHAVLLDHAKKHQMKGVFLETSDNLRAANAFYERMGYIHESSASYLPWFLDTSIRFPLYRMNF